MPGEETTAITATAMGSMLTDTTVTTVYENGAVKDGKFVATPKLKSNIFTTRLKKLKKSYTIDMMVEDMSTDFNVVPYVPKNF